MNKLFALLLAYYLVPSLLRAQCDERYLNPIFTSAQFFENVIYAKDAPKMFTSVNGVETIVSRDLKMDIYMPPPTDTVLERPVVIFAHGGGFIDVALMGGTVVVGTKENDDVQALCDSFARRGFVAASIEYRTGFDPLSSKSMLRAVWRGTQDMSRAIRFFRENAAWFDIDPNRVFIGGSSAGAFTVLHATFADASERPAETYAQKNLLGITIADDLKALHVLPVVKLTSFNPFSGNNVLTPTVDSLANGFVSYWGAIGDLAFIDGVHQRPGIFFHGLSDSVVSPYCAKPFDGYVLGAPVTCGTLSIQAKLQSNGIQHEMYTEAGEGHEYWGVLNGGWLPSGPSVYWQPIIQKTSAFFYQLMQEQAPILQGSTTVYKDSIVQYSIANPNPQSSYCWDIQGGQQIISSNPQAATVEVLWQATAGSTAVINVREVDQADVASLWGTKQVTIQTSVNTEEVATRSYLKLYPNPVDQILRIERLESAVDIHVYNLLGEILWQSSKEVNSLLEISTKDWPSGQYLLEIRQKTSGRRLYKRFSVQH